ncbi:hypothetical protein J14TS2_47140 [Bacillus sp. J14TS2]|nr:hypothetical protein J14TS2_47140 [Bacillus sp. J14TS2]
MELERWQKLNVKISYMISSIYLSRLVEDELFDFFYPALTGCKTPLIEFALYLSVLNKQITL